MNKRDLKKLSKSQLIKMLLKQEKSKKVRNHEDLLDNDPFKDEVAQREPAKCIKLRDSKTGRFVRINSEVPKPPKQPALPRLRDAKGRFISRQQSQPVVQQAPIQLRIKPPKPTRKPPPPPILQLEDKERITDVSSPKITQIQKALKNSTKSFAVDIVDNKDPLHQLTETKKVIEHYLNKKLGELKGFKYIETLKVTFEKQLGDEIITKTAYFNGRVRTIINEKEIDESLQLSRQQIMKAIGQWISEGSGWTIKSVDGQYINLTKYKPLKGSSYIELPTELRNSSKGLINMKNEDNECFRWCHIRHLNPQDKYPQRIKKVDKQFIKNLNYSGIEFPVTTKQYNKIEKQNKININVFGYEDRQPYPIYISKEKYEDCMNLLLITENENKHYVLIKDFNKLMYNQTKHKERKHFCMYCLQCFSSNKILNNHKDNCIQVNGTQAVNMPDKDNNILKFNNFHKQQPVPFVIYSDFEAITKKIQGCRQNNDSSYTEAYQKHTDCGYGYKVVCCYDDKYTKPTQIYRGPKAVYKFMKKMLEEVKYCKNIMKKEFNKPLKMTKNDEEEFQKAKECHILIKNILTKIFEFETIVILQVNTEALLIKSVT